MAELGRSLARTADTLEEDDTSLQYGYDLSCSLFERERPRLGAFDGKCRKKPKAPSVVRTMRLG